MSDNFENKAARGSISQIILKALNSGDKYGYEIIKDIEILTDGKLILKQPSLYSSLRRMEEQDLISSYWKDSDIGGKRHYYSITTKGKEFFEENKKNWLDDEQLINSLPTKEEKEEFDYLEDEEYFKNDINNNSTPSTVVLNQENLFNLNRQDKDIKKIDANKEAEEDENNKSFFQFDFFEQNIKFVKENSNTKQEISAFSNKFSNMDNKGSEIEPDKKSQLTAYINNNEEKNIEKIDDTNFNENKVESETDINLTKPNKTPTPVLKSNKKIYRNDIYNLNGEHSEYNELLEKDKNIISNSNFNSLQNISKNEEFLTEASEFSKYNFEEVNLKNEELGVTNQQDFNTNDNFNISNQSSLLFNEDSIQPLENIKQDKETISWDFETEYSDENAIFSDNDYKTVIGQLYNNSRLDDPYEQNKFQTFKEIFPHSQVKNEKELEQQKIEQEEIQKERLSQIIKSSEESNIDCEDIKKLNSLYNLQGIQIKVHSSQENKKNSKKYTDKNKLNMVSSWIISAIMILELMFSYYILKSNNLYSNSSSLVYFLGIAVTLSYCLISTFENLFDRFKLVIIEKSFKKSFLHRLFIFILLVVVIFAVNLFFGMTSLTETFYLSFWIIPTLLAFNIPLSSIVYYLLLKSKAYNS